MHLKFVCLFCVNFFIFRVNNASYLLGLAASAIISACSGGQYFDGSTCRETPAGKFVFKRLTRIKINWHFAQLVFISTGM